MKGYTNRERFHYCEMCGEPYFTHAPHSCYCSDECRQKAKKEYSKEYYRGPGRKIKREYARRYCKRKQEKIKLLELIAEECWKNYTPLCFTKEANNLLVLLDEYYEKYK